MSKYHVKRIVLVTVILGLLTSVGLWFAMQQRARPASRQTIILLHGYGSSARATTAVATAIQTQTHLKRRQQVNVSPQGMVKLSGTTHQLQQGGIYQLNFTDKQTTAQQASAALALVTDVQSASCQSSRPSWTLDGGDGCVTRVIITPDTGYNVSNCYAFGYHCRTV